MSGGRSGARVSGETAAPAIGGRRVGWGTAGPTHTPGYYRVRAVVRGGFWLACAAALMGLASFGLGGAGSLLEAAGIPL